MGPPLTVKRRLWASMVMLEAILLVVQASSKVNLSVGRSGSLDRVEGPR